MNVDGLPNILRKSIRILSRRGLKKSCNWAGEILQSFLLDGINRIANVEDFSPYDNENESDLYFVIKPFFDLGEFKRYVFFLF